VICQPGVALNEDVVSARFGEHNTDKINFVSDILSFLTSISEADLKKKLSLNENKISFKLNGVQVDLELNKDFYLS
jgi:hypothetical protein